MALALLALWPQDRAYAGTGEGPRAGASAPLPPAVVVEPEGLLEPVTDLRSLAGYAVAIDGDVAIVGVPGLIDGGSGSVYVFRRLDRAWGTTPVQVINNPDGALPTGDNFGASLAWRGGFLVIGAPGDGPTTSSNAGTAYLFAYDPAMPSRPFSLVAGGLPRPAGGPSRFGTSVAVSDDFIVVGAPDTGSSMPGAAYVYDAPFMAMPTALDAGRTGPDDLFGASVAVAGATIVVGAPLFDAPMDEGIALTYDHDGTAWGPAIELTSSAMRAHLGTAVGVSEDGLRIVIGAPFATTPASSQGAVFVFERADRTMGWPATPLRITASDGVASDYFGSSIAVAGSDFVVGAAAHDEPGAAASSETGSVYLFRGADRTEVARFRAASSRMDRDRLGFAVALDGDTVIAGAPATGSTNQVGFAASFRMPFGDGIACDLDAQCESGHCVMVGGAGVCCESACDGACQACSAAGVCEAANETESCDPGGGCTGTCTAGVCTSAAGCTVPDAGPDSGPVDAGPPARRRVSGCRCEVGGGASPRGAGALVLLLGVALLARRRARGVLVALLAASLSLPGVVRAQEGAEADVPSAGDASDAPDEETQALLVEAIREYDSGNYEEAYALFLRVHEARPSARTERALGNAAFELRHYRQAVEWLELALADDRNALTDGMRAEVAGVLRRARAFLGSFVIEVDVEGAEVSVDGHLLEGGEAILDLGEHEIAVSAEGYFPETRSVTVHGGEAEHLSFELERMPVTGTEGPDPGAIYRDLGWASVISGGVLLLGGIISTAIWADVVGRLNANIDVGICEVDENENVINDSLRFPQVATCLDQQNRYRLALPFAYLGFVGGAVFLGLGLGLVVGAPSRPTEGSVTVSCGPFAEAGLGCSGTF